MQSSERESMQFYIICKPAKSKHVVSICFGCRYYRWDENTQRWHWDDRQGLLETVPSEYGLVGGRWVIPVQGLGISFGGPASLPCQYPRTN